MVVNLAVLTALWDVIQPREFAVAIAIGVAMLSNFVLNRWITFSYARHRNVWKQLIGFLAGSSMGAVVNFLVTLYLLYQFPSLEDLPQPASVAGILSGLVFNYAFSRYVVFHKKSL